MPATRPYNYIDPTLSLEQHSCLTLLDVTDACDLATLEKLNALNLSTTLVVTLKKGVNDDEVGAVVDFALKQKCVRGMTFQPVQDAAA